MGTSRLRQGSDSHTSSRVIALKINQTSEDTLINRIQLAAGKFAAGVESAFAGFNMNMSVA